MSETKLSLPAFFGVKAGMTRIFDNNGNHVPVTVVKLIPNIVSQVKTSDKDGYSAYQLAYGEKRKSLVTKPNEGQLKKANITQSLTKFSEVKVENASTDAVGKSLNSEITAKTMYNENNEISVANEKPINLF